MAIMKNLFPLVLNELPIDKYSKSYSKYCFNNKTCT